MFVLKCFAKKGREETKYGTKSWVIHNKQFTIQFYFCVHLKVFVQIKRKCKKSSTDF